MLILYLYFITFIQSVKSQHPLTVQECLADEYQCFTGVCIPLTKYCDAIMDCSDNSDEKDCELECIQRHDVYGSKYRGMRIISKSGQQCSSYCRSTEGLGLACFVNGQRTMCHVPLCDTLQGRTMDCTAFDDACHWQDGSITNDTTITSDSRSLYIEGHSNGQATLVSPLFAIPSEETYAYCILYTYGIETSGIVGYDVISRDNTKLEWREGTCSRCYLKIEKDVFELYQTQVRFGVFWRPRSEFSLKMELISFEIIEDECHGYQDLKVQCPPDQYTCYDQKCIPTDFINDQLDDCDYNADEKHQYETEEECDVNSIYCSLSKSCIPRNSSQIMIVQCYISENLPVEPSKISCPAYLRCKHKQGDKQVCVSADQVCDGIPNCPHWDDEMDCDLPCPSDCSQCIGRRFYCPSRALPHISTRASYIDLSGYQLNITALCSRRRSRLVFLNISFSGVANADCTIDKRLFPSLQQLDLSSNHIEKLSNEDHSNLVLINISINPLRLIDKVNLYWTMIFSRCNISEIYWVRNVALGNSYLAFNEIPPNHVQIPNEDCYCSSIDLSWNYISRIDSLQRCKQLKTLHLHHNNLTILTATSFGEYVAVLNNLTLSHNRITHIGPNLFFAFKQLRKLEIMANVIQYIHESAFLGLRNLRILALSQNVISTIRPRTFSDLSSLQELYLQQNELNYLHKDTFFSLRTLVRLDLRRNHLTFLPDGLFENMLELKYLDLRENNIKMSSFSSRGLGKLKYLKVDSFTLCCARPKSVENDKCFAPEFTLSSCSHLLGKGFLSVIIWFICLTVFIVNIYCISYTIREGISCGKDILKLNILFSDIILGIYMTMIAYTDVIFKGKYSLHHYDWISGDLCKVAGIIHMISIDASLLLQFITVVYRYTTLKITFVKHDFAVCIAVSILVWIISCVVSILPTMLLHTNSYSVNVLCAPLLLIVLKKDSEIFQWKTMLIIYMSINVLILCGVITGEIRIKQEIKRHRAKVQMSPMESISITTLFTLSSAIRLLSASPTLVFGCLTLLDVSVYGEVYLWTIIMILPLPSLLNPIFLRQMDKKSNMMFKQCKNKCFRIVNAYPSVIIRSDTQNPPIESQADIAGYLYTTITPHQNDMVLLTLHPGLGFNQALQVWFRDNNGWTHKSQNVKIQNKAVTCEIPSYSGEDCHLEIQIILMESVDRSSIYKIPVRNRC